MALLIFAVGCAAEGQQPGGGDLSALSLEQLTQLEVNTVSRRDQKLFETPAAAFVITRDDILRSGVTSVPELLRMVPGLEAAQIDANTWAVSARGFNSRFANKMLIMIDNRSIYNPVFSGTLWDQNDLMLEDIERIEVVRGPGGTMWGANAVNGVINIVTRKASDTRGALVAGDAGRIEQGAAVRWGACRDAHLCYRVFAKGEQRSALLAYDGTSAQDSGSAERLGTRMDWNESGNDRLTVEANLLRNPEQQRIDFGYSPTDFSVSPVYGTGGNLMGRWEHTAGSSNVALEGYYGDEHRTEIGMKLNVQIADLDFQHHVAAGARNDLVWGAGFRWTSDRTGGRQTYFAHPNHIVNLSSTFVQDSLTLVPATLAVTAGTKLQWNTYTHFEIQPSVRLVWTPDTTNTIWAGWSRAVRTPSDQDHDVDFLYPMGTADGLPLNGLILGNPRLASEVLLADESGYRHRFGEKLSLDLAGFFNRYTDLEATSVGTPYVVSHPSPSIVQPFLYVNGFAANAEGAEAAVAWTPRRDLRFQTAYAWMQARLVSHTDAEVEPSGGQDWSTPRNTLDVRGFWDLEHHWSLSAVLNANSTVPSMLPSPYAVIPQHARVDLRVSRSLGEEFAVAAGVTNLLHRSHAEFFPEDYTMNSYIPRSAYVGLRWNP
ncbi:MAG TPA: TonB-dependent receptor [Acidobacteriaceae bacterium]|nr:TonB-dependent receptor [Acidobacteriaceae bacterium]